MKISGIIFGTLFLLPVVIILNSFAFQNMWNWFLYPIIGYNLSFVHAIGLNALISFATGQYQEEYENKKESIKVFVSWFLLRPLFVLFFGYIINYIGV